MRKRKTIKRKMVPLTVSYLAKHIGIPVKVFERQIGTEMFDIQYSFTASGNAEKAGKVYPGWLKTRKPAIKKNDLFIIGGLMRSKDIDATLQAGPSGLVSTNLMNTEAFVRI